MSFEGDEPAPLGEGARNILLAARPHEGLGADRKERLRGRVMAAVVAGTAVGAAAGAAKAAEIAGGAAAGANAGVGASVGAGAVKIAGLSVFAKIGIGLAAVTIGVGGVMWSRVKDDAARPVAPVAADSAVASSTGAAPEPKVPSSEPSATNETASAPAPLATDKPVAPKTSAPAEARPSAEPSAEAVDSLQEETKMLAAAHAELSRGNAAAALVILDQHAAKFPRGTLAPERRATRAMALCKAGRTDEGRRELEALYGGGSKSPMAQKIDRACGK